MNTPPVYADKMYCTCIYLYMYMFCLNRLLVRELFIFIFGIYFGKKDQNWTKELITVMNIRLHFVLRKQMQLVM